MTNPTSKEVRESDRSATLLRSELLRNGVLDEEGVHHEFVSGAHGRKLDFDKIETGSSLYNLWIGAMVAKTRELYDETPPVLMGVANGANRVARSMAPLLGYHIQGVATEKLSAKKVGLTDLGKLILRETEPELVLVVEDVGTTGGTTSTAVEALREEGVDQIESLVTWQRQANLPKLDEISVPYHAVILDPLPTFSPDECSQSPDGYCSQGYELIPHGQ